MAGLIRAGKVRHWGFSNFDPSQITEIVRLCDENSWPRPVISQPPYSWLNRDVEKEVLPICRKSEIAVTPYQPLQGGLLTGKYRRGEPLPPGSRVAESSWLREPDDALYDRLDQFEAGAKVTNLQPANYAIKWLLDQPGIASVVVGVKRIEQLENLQSGIC
jgi:L-glyceraldehyde 3-phosphate reductase